MGVVGEGERERERSEHVTHAVHETLKQWNCNNSLLQIKIVVNAYGRP